MEAKQQTRPPAYSAERESRVAAALRENLRKRKAQQQAKTGQKTKD
ncbi:MAG: hypothetical protein SFW62_08445 [Alphaproteobacteria bacterium]|nr:hypothetical protein [Alphaproteobacteria bacterium]